MAILTNEAIEREKFLKDKMTILIQPQDGSMRVEINSMLPEDYQIACYRAVMDAIEQIFADKKILL